MANEKEIGMNEKIPGLAQEVVAEPIELTGMVAQKR